jgi:putative protease
MDRIELLAPAKDLECGIAAINCGADALYVGPSRFGAREAAGNSVEDIAELVRYAHKYWAKVYATVNTILFDDEIPSALRLISRLYDTGIDGLIIQDVGLLECELPPIPLIASTQMHNSTPEKVEFLEKVGFQRAILARELDIEQIKAIRNRTTIELEFFIHGALCVGYSGQCYLSYALGGRSGNRGQCAQPCRKPYSLVDAEGNTLSQNKHLLSLRDLNLTEHLGELIQAGASSFKIEGRLKDKAYVSNVVAHYRKALDIVLEGAGKGKSSSGRSIIDFIPDVSKTFNRGYSTYFLHGRGNRVDSVDTPKMVGETVGKVVSISGSGVKIESDIEIHRGDGVCFFDRAGELCGTNVNQAHGRTFTPAKTDGIERGTIIYRNHDHEFLMKLGESHIERLIAVRMILRETENGVSVSAVDEDENIAEFSFTCEKNPAQKSEQAIENFQKQLMKSGGTKFDVLTVDIELPEPYFLPISALNALRREVLENLASVRLENRPVKTVVHTVNSVPYPEKELSYLGNVLNSRAEAFYHRHGVSRIEPAAESGLDMHDRKVMTTRYCIKHQLGACPKDENSERLNSPLFLQDAEGHKLELRFNCAKCEMEVHLPPSLGKGSKQAT